jgi:hypothetical protein
VARKKTTLPAVLAALLSYAAAQPALAQAALRAAPAQAPAPDATPGYYDPALRRFTPLREENTAVTSYNQTITFTPKFQFQSAFQNQFTTIRCHLDVNYLSASSASATNDYSPGDVVSLSVNIAFRSSNPNENVTYYLECVGIDVFDEEHDWRQKYVAHAQSGPLNLAPVIAF